MSMYEAMDADLVCMARADDTEAFRLLIERYRPMAFAIALRQVSQQETAQDLVQEATLQAYLSLDQLQDASHFKNWFYGIVLNTCRYWRRRQHASFLSLDEGAEDLLKVDDADPSDLLEENELRVTVQEALQQLSIKNRTAMVLFYYEDISIEEIAAQLKLSPSAVKSRLYQGRNQLQKLLTTRYPELSSNGAYKRRRKNMAYVNMNLVRLAQVEQQFLVVLLDEAKQRAMTLWLHPMEGRALAILKGVIKVPGPKTSLDPAAYLDFVADMLQATGATVQSVRLEELQKRLFYTRVILQNPIGTGEVKGRMGDGLALAVRAGCPITIEDTMLMQYGIQLPNGSSKKLDQRLDEIVKTVSTNAHPPRQGKFPRLPEPKNLQFTEGLEHWELRGSFFHDGAALHWQDYSSGADEIGPQPRLKSGYLKSQVSEPQGFADLRQAIVASNYLGKRVRLSADIKTVEVDQHAGLYLRVIDPLATRPPEEREQVTFQGTQDWTRYETQREVPANSVFILFGISLSGKGQVWVTNVQLESVS